MVLEIPISRALTGATWNIQSLIQFFSYDRMNNAGSLELTRRDLADLVRVIAVVKTHDLRRIFPPS